MHDTTISSLADTLDASEVTDSEVQLADVELEHGKMDKSKSKARFTHRLERGLASTSIANFFQQS